MERNPIAHVDPLGLYRNPFAIDHETENKAKEKYPKNEQWNVRGDAYRHCLASCMMTRNNGTVAAWLLGGANEQMSFNQPQEEHDMDNWNSSCGNMADEPPENGSCSDQCARMVDQGVTDNGNGGQEWGGRIIKIFAIIKRFAFPHFLIIFLVSCGVKENIKGVMLIDHVESFSEESEFLIQHSELRSAGNANRNSDDRKNKISTYEGNNYSHLGFNGAVEISFFEGKLLEVRFYPYNIDAYSATFQKTVFDEQYLKVWSALDYRNRRYYGFEDIRLEKKADNWVRYN